MLQGKGFQGMKRIQKDVIFPLMERTFKKYHLYDLKLQTAKALSIQNRQVSWLVTVLSSFPLWQWIFPDKTFGYYLQLRDSS